MDDPRHTLSVDLELYGPKDRSCGLEPPGIGRVQHAPSLARPERRGLV